MSVSGRGGRVVLAPGADRAGVHTHRDVLQFARKVSALTGETLRIGTGTAHSRLTVNGTVSDHWRGEGADIGATGANLVKLGRAALIAAGMSPAQARKQKGGGYNIGGWQIIFATNAPGWGNHRRTFTSADGADGAWRALPPRLPTRGVRHPGHAPSWRRFG
jgi:hypothetical protein